MTEEGYLLGVDVGSTKTHAVIADTRGRAKGFGRSGPGNHEVVGYEGLFTALQESLNGALSTAGVSMDEIIGAGFGVSGYDWPPERQPTRDTIGLLGLSCPFEAVNDAMLGLIAGASDGWGLAVVAGTGCNCRGLDAEGREGRVTGDGETFGEYGSAGSIVDEALHAVAYEWCRRGPATQLTPSFVERAGARDVDDLIEGLVLERYSLGASLAPLVFQVAQQGDDVAQQVIRWAGRELGEMAAGVIHQLGFESRSFEVVLIGRLFDGEALFTEALRDTIEQVASGARLVRLQAPPVVGGVLLGFRQAGLDPRTVRAQVLRSTAALLQGMNAEE